MKCPSCGNDAKAVSGVFFGLSMLRFKCQYCNDELRGSAVMIFLDGLSFVLIGVFAVAMSMFAERLLAVFDDFTFPLLGIMGVLCIRLTLSWLMVKAGAFRNVR